VLRAVAPRRRPRGLPSWVAVESLCAFDDDAAPVIADATLHPDPAVRHVAATVIGVRPVPGAAPVVRDRLAQETDPRALAAFVDALGWVGGAQDLAVLSEFARHRDESVALAAVESLERLGLPASVAALAPLVEDTRPRLAERAAVALTELGPAGRERLLGALDGETPAVHPAHYALQLSAMRGAGRGVA